MAIETVTRPSPRVIDAYVFDEALEHLDEVIAMMTTANRAEPAFEEDAAHLRLICGVAFRTLHEARSRLVGDAGEGEA